MKRIVVGVDGSDEATKALRYAARLAAPLGAEMIVVNVVSPPAYPTDLYPIAVGEVEKQARQFGHSVTKRAIEAIADLQVSARDEVISGAPAESLADMTERVGGDLLVVGSRGLGAVKRVLLGSTSDRLVHICKRPVLVVH
jgi:nucleotide-binding universal stress UspA family protein